MRGSFVLAAVLLANAPAASADSTISNVAEVQVHPSGMIRFRLASNANLCASAPAARNWGDIVVGVNGVTAEGQRTMMQGILAAKLAGRPITVWANNGPTGGSGYCSVWAIEVR